MRLRIGTSNSGRHGTRFWLVFAAAVVAALNGAQIIRAHDVRATVDAMKVVQAVNEAGT